MKSAVRRAFWAILVVTLVQTACYSTPKVVREFTLPILSRTPFRARIAGDWVLCGQQFKQNDGLGDPALILYNVVTKKNHTLCTGWQNYFVDIGGSLAVWTDNAGNIQGYSSLKSNQTTASKSNLVLVDTSTWKYYTPPLQYKASNPVVCGTYVAYGCGRSIFLLDLNSGQTRRLTDGVNYAAAPDIGQDLVIWTESAINSNIRQIWAYRISTGETIKVTDDSAVDHCSERTDGKTIVWWTPKGGGSWAYDVATGNVRNIGGKSSFFPDVDNGMVVYQKSGGCVYGYDLAKGQEFQISKVKATNGPSIDGNRVVWVSGKVIHVAEIQRN